MATLDMLEADWKDKLEANAMNECIWSSSAAVKLYKIKGDYLNTVVTLIENGANINAADDEGVTPLHTACCENNTEIVQVLLDNKANINNITTYGSTPMHSVFGIHSPVYGKFAPKNFSSEKSCSKIIDKLHQQDPTMIEVVDWDSETTLMMAVSSGISTAVNACILFGADLNAVDEDGSTDLHIAIERVNNDIAKTLIEEKASLDICNGNGETPLHRATEMGNIEIVKILLERGADLDIVNNNGVRAMNMIDSISLGGNRFNSEELATRKKDMKDLFTKQINKNSGCQKTEINDFSPKPRSLRDLSTEAVRKKMIMAKEGGIEFPEDEKQVLLRLGGK